jgi:hypothetical protein
LCRRRESNSHGFLRTILSRVRLPIPPLRLIYIVSKIIIYKFIFVNLAYKSNKPGIRMPGTTRARHRIAPNRATHSFTYYLNSLILLFTHSTRCWKISSDEYVSTSSTPSSTSAAVHNLISGAIATNRVCTSESLLADCLEASPNIMLNWRSSDQHASRTPLTRADSSERATFGARVHSR